MRLYLLALLGVLFLATAACRRDQIFDGEAALRFEVDTLKFDTVFTQMGSSTKRFKVYNPYNQPVVISSIRLGGGSGSYFRLNVDGDVLSSNVIRDLEIPANDSIYVFANVIIDPNNTNNPLVVFDSLMFETNGTEQKVMLQAYGQDANYIGQLGYITLFSNENVVFNNQKPYVLMGWLLFDSLSTLTIQPGARLYMFGGPTSRPGDRAMIYIGKNSTLRVNGTAQEPVRFQTHRLEDDFQELPFQWQGIYLSAESRNNQVDYAIVRNAVFGFRVDSLSTNANPKLALRNSFVYNVDEGGIIGVNGSVYAENTVVVNSNNYNLLLVYGGNYVFNNCTFANFGTNPFVGRNEPVLTYRNYLVVYDNAGNRSVIDAEGQARFTNCILYGNRSNEIELEKADNSASNLRWLFENCLVKVDTLNYGLVDCIKNQDPRFEEVEEYDYHIDSLISPLIDAGTLNIRGYSNGNISIPFDFDGYPRSGNPDIGAFEFR
jgi:hypothetical protein